MNKLILIFSTLTILSCTHSDFIWASDIDLSSRNQNTTYISSGDEVQVTFWKHEELNTKDIIDRDGFISIMFIGPIKLAGKTESEAEDLIRSKISSFIIEPNISIKISQQKERHASVIGEVKKPGTYVVDGEETVFHLLARAGGLTEYADHDSIYIIRKNKNLKRIRFKFKDLSSGEKQLVFFPIEDGDILYAE